MDRGKIFEPSSAIRYVDRDFRSIKEFLENYAKRYYPDTVSDFTTASFNSLMVDNVALVGDILSFYLDYQANESYLDTSIEIDNIVKHGKLFGYKTDTGYSSCGSAYFYVSVPADASGIGPDTDYVPVIYASSVFGTVGGNNFVLVDDVDFSNDAEIRVGKVNAATGSPLTYIYKKMGKVVSGTITQQIEEVGSFERFLKVYIDDANVTEIISVIDSAGREYYEVDFLSQNIVYKELNNEGVSNPAMILSPVVVDRRFVVERDANGVYLQFGSGSDSVLEQEYVNDPQAVILERTAKNYISSLKMDPSKLIGNDKFGVAPENTNLIIKYRTNSYENVNVGSGALNSVVDARIGFVDAPSLEPDVSALVRDSIEIENEESIVGYVVSEDAVELKRRMFDSFATQYRVVSEVDYKAWVYHMPPKYGAIKRVGVVSNTSPSVKDEINIYLVSQDSDGVLVAANDSIKENVQTWIKRHKGVKDKVNLLDAYIINIGIDFEIIVANGYDKYDVLSEAIENLSTYYSYEDEIGENFLITNIYSVLKEIDGILDVSRVRIFQKKGGNYSDVRFDLNEFVSADGRYIQVPKNCILEVKYPSIDISGAIK